MPFEYKFQVNHLDRALKAVRRSIDQPDKLLDSVGESLLRVNRDRHKSGLAPDGSKWMPLSPLTIGSAVWRKQGDSFRKNGQMSLAVAKKVQARKSRILYDSGDMLNSFHYHVQASRLTLDFDGSRESKLAAWHHSGTKPYEIKPRNKKALAFAGIVTKRVQHPGLPSRKLVGLPDSDRRLIADVAGDYLLVILNRVR